MFVGSWVSFAVIGRLGSKWRFIDGVVVGRMFRYLLTRSALWICMGELIQETDGGG